MYYIHKFEAQQCYGGPEEGGWWYDAGVPVESNLFCSDSEDSAYEVCRAFNEAERERRDEEEPYGYTSVLSAQSTHYSYSVEEEAVAVPFPAKRPFYE